MTLNPGIIALLVTSILTALMLSYSALFGLRVLRRWDLKSGSPEQLLMERKTYLISTLLMNVLVFEVLALFLFIQTAERLHGLFVGAMCAAGTLYVNPFGYPALMARITLSALAGLWLLINRMDNRSPSYPLIRLRYGMLMALAPLALASATLSWMYLTGLKADVITSCCGALFSQGSESVVQEVSVMGREWLITRGYVLATALMFIVGALLWKTGRGAAVFGLLSALLLPLGLGVVIVWVSPYVYELPTHHCPFCMIQADYNYIGYPVYALLFLGSVAGMGAAVAGLFRSRLGVDGSERGLVLAALALLGLFNILLAWLVLSSNLTMN